MHNLAVSMHAQGGRKRTIEAERMLRQALQIRRWVLGSDHVDVADTLNVLSVIVHNIGSKAEARYLQMEAKEINRKAGIYIPETVGFWSSLSSWFRSTPCTAGQQS